MAALMPSVYKPLETPHTYSVCMRQGKCWCILIKTKRSGSGTDREDGPAQSNLKALDATGVLDANRLKARDHTSLSGQTNCSLLNGPSELASPAVMFVHFMRRITLQCIMK